MSDYFHNLRIFNAENFKSSIDPVTEKSNVYMTFGKSDTWTDDSSVPATTANNKMASDVWYQMIGAKKIGVTDIRHVIRRYDWEANTVYAQWDDQDEDILDGNTNFFVLNSSNNVYKCIDNKNNRKSNVEPTTTNTSTVSTTADGYTWKYMYSLTDEERLRFTTDDYIPVKTLKNDDGTLQWDVQQNATEGAIYSVIVTDGGDGYTNVSNIIVNITGDGEGAIATATLDSNTNTVNAIVMTTYGSGYSRATVRISGGGGANAAARPVISPFGGHGSNPVYELGGSNLYINTRLVGDENGKYPTETEFRQIGIVKDPIKYGTTTVSSNIAVSQTMDISLINYAVGVGVPTDYEVGEYVYQGTSSSIYDFRGRVTDWDANNNIVRVTQIEGVPIQNQSLLGSNTTTSKSVNSVVNPELKPYSGQVLYVDNFLPVTKDSDQSEDLKVLIKF